MKFEENKLARSARRWVLALGIIYCIVIITSIVGLFTLLSLKSTDYATIRTLGEAGAGLIEMYEIQSTPINLAIQGLIAAGQLFAVILLFRGASVIKKGLEMDKTPFYILLGLLVVSNIFSISMNSGLSVEGAGFTIFSAIGIVVSILLIAIPFYKVTKYNNTVE